MILEEMCLLKIVQIKVGSFASTEVQWVQRFLKETMYHADATIRHPQKIPLWV